MSGVSAGWRGADHESHLFLSPEDDEMVCAAHARAAGARGALDAKLKGLEAASAPNGGELEGLKYSLKDLDSLRRKVASDVAEGTAASSVIAETRDLNRYTMCFPAESYSSGVAESFDHLKAQGLEPYKPEETHKNTWENPSYKGINTSWTDQETGQVLEIQFHTPESFAVKSDNHTLYELSRSGAFDRREMAAADWLQAQRYKDVKIPEGHDSTVPAKPPRELKAFPPEVLDKVRAKEAELKQHQVSASPATGDPPRSADENDVDPEKGIPEPPETDIAAEDPNESPDIDADEQGAREADGAPGAEGARDQSAGAAYDDYEDEQMARIAAAKGEPESDGSRSVDADDVASAESAQDAPCERPEAGESEESSPQPVDEGVTDGPKADTVPEGQGPDEPGEADADTPDAEDTALSTDAEDAQGQDAAAAYEDHEDRQMARIAAATDEQQESDDGYGETYTPNREREGI